MIVEQRMYTIQHGRIGEWLDYYEKNGLPLQQKHLGKLVGFFQGEIGVINQVVHMWAYESLAHREECRARLNADPAWQDYMRNSPKVILGMENRILKPVSFSPLR